MVKAFELIASCSVAIASGGVATRYLGPSAGLLITACMATVLTARVFQEPLSPTFEWVYPVVGGRLDGGIIITPYNPKRGDVHYFESHVYSFTRECKWQFVVTQSVAVSES